ncbi:MAG TPA: ABC transporter permease [Candidatus Acidoferrum sp.]
MIFREVGRFLRSSPLLSLSAVVVLAVGLGASAFALALLMALSSSTYPGMRGKSYATIAEETEGGGSVPITWQRFVELRESSRRDEYFAAYSRPIAATMNVHGDKKPLNVAATSAGFFSTFTSNLVAGRDFSPSEEGQAGKHVIILSDSLATVLFQSPHSALEQIVIIDDLPYEIVGVAPRHFAGIFGDAYDGWVPANCVIPLILKLPSQAPADSDIWQNSSAFFALAASDGLSSEKLTLELSSGTALQVGSEAALHASSGLTNDPLRDARLRKELRFGLLLAVIFTIVSSLNYCLLLLARTPRFIEEVRLKKALGAGRGRLTAELMAGPSAMVAAGLAGACVFCAISGVLLYRASAFQEQLARGSWHWAYLALAVQIPVACCLTLMIALVPALRFLRDDGAPGLGYASTPVRRTGFHLQVLVTLQIGFCMGTCILAGMIFSAVLFLQRQALGFDPSHLTVVGLRPATGTVSFVMDARKESGQSYPSASATRSLLAEINAVPGVRSSSLASTGPLGKQMDTVSIQAADNESTVRRTVYEIAVTPDYFRTIGTRLLRGRDFSPQARFGDAHEVVVNQILAKELWGDGNAVNRSIKLTSPGRGGGPTVIWLATVIGVVEDMQLSGLTASPEPTIFQNFMDVGGFEVTPDVVVNGTESMGSLQEVIKTQVASQMSQLAPLEVYGVGERLRGSLRLEEERAYFALAAALVMAVVACIGLYGALAYYVGTRRREIAVRICLGASPWAIRKLVMARAMWCAGAATIFSMALWPGFARLASSDYLGRVAWSTGRAVAISLACVLVAVLVSLRPARSAGCVSPSEMLKDQ